MQRARRATRIASHLPVDMPHLAFVNATAQAAFATLDRVAQVDTYVSTVTYPNNGLAQALRAVAGAIVKGIGTRVFWVQTGGFDTHAGQAPNQANGAYATLMATLNDGAVRVLQRPAEPGPARRHAGAAVLGVRPPHHRERQPRHRSRRGQRDDGDGRRRPRRDLRHGAEPRSDADNPTLENNGGDVRYETDFRSVYARVLDDWLGASSTTVLGGDFRGGAPAFLGVDSRTASYTPKMPLMAWPMSG